MIKFTQLSNDLPYSIFKKKYDVALNANQKNIEAVCISSYSSHLNEVNSRFVNLKLVDQKDFIFFTNYESPKSIEFEEHNQITAVFYWSTVDIQIRLKALIKKTTKDFNDIYFSNRSKKKNALAISSRQSKKIDSYEKVIENHNKALELDNLSKCPEYWGGYKFTPYYFEFWEGHELRLNKRQVYKIKDDNWEHLIIQP